MNNNVEILGLPRSYFYRRLAGDMRHILQRGYEPVEEERETEMVVKVNVQDALNRLVRCPVCGTALLTYPDYPLERSCNCGEFTITEVWSDGDVTFEFKMTAPEKLGEDVADAPVDGE